MERSRSESGATYTPARRRDSTQTLPCGASPAEPPARDTEVATTTHTAETAATPFNQDRAAKRPMHNVDYYQAYSEKTTGTHIRTQTATREEDRRQQTATREEDM